VGDQGFLRREFQFEVLPQERREAVLDLLGCASRDWRLIM
jgi:hypothetical protein